MTVRMNDPQARSEADREAAREARVTKRVVLVITVGMIVLTLALAHMLRGKWPRDYYDPDARKVFVGEFRIVPARGGKEIAVYDSEGRHLVRFECGSGNRDLCARIEGACCPKGRAAGYFHSARDSPRRLAYLEEISVDGQEWLSAAEGRARYGVVRTGGWPLVYLSGTLALLGLAWLLYPFVRSRIVKTGNKT